MGFGLLEKLIEINCVEINPLSLEDAILDYGQLGNFSLAGFEMVLTRYVSTYIITYYLPSGETALCITSDLEQKDIKERTKYQKTL